MTEIIIVSKTFVIKKKVHKNLFIDNFVKKKFF